jgi:microsomal dipeptidase-like Zn-dependent dipeptidase
MTVRVVDLHAHPSLKTTLFGLRWDHRHRPGPAFNPLSLRCDLPKLVAGGVSALCSAVYVPERGLLADCLPLRVALLGFPHIRHLVEGDPFRGAMRMLEDFEEIVAATPAVDGVRATVVRSPAELAAAVGAGRLAIVHTLEGAHHLAGDPANVARFHARGVAMLTLAHFYPNDVAPPVDGIPPAQKHLGCFQAPKDLTATLGPLGHDVVEEMLRLGMLVDLTHCTPPARAAVLEQVGTRRPLVMSHVGAGSLHAVPMNPTADEVRRIADTGGVIGVIAMDYWLGGNDGNDGSDGRRKESSGGIALVVRTIRALADQGGIDVVALGTDFDGFTDPPDDLQDPSHLPRLTDALLASGVGEGDVEKIVGGNALRVLLGR